jgi:signal transduction histidine kinase
MFFLHSVYKNALAYLIHEMRTPLQVIQLSIELIGIEQNNLAALNDRLGLSLGCLA